MILNAKVVDRLICSGTLVDLADQGEEHPKPLTTLGFNLESLQKARTISHEILVLLLASNGAKDEKNQAKLLRDTAYTLLYKKVRERREYGRYIFWKNAERCEKYLID